MFNLKPAEFLQWTYPFFHFGLKIIKKGVVILENKTVQIPFKLHRCATLSSSTLVAKVDTIDTSRLRLSWDVHHLFPFHYLKWYCKWMYTTDINWFLHSTCLMTFKYQCNVYTTLLKQNRRKWIKRDTFNSISSNKHRISVP